MVVLLEAELGEDLEQVVGLVSEVVLVQEVAVDMRWWQWWICLSGFESGIILGIAYRFDL